MRLGSALVGSLTGCSASFFSDSLFFFLSFLPKNTNYAIPSITLRTEDIVVLWKKALLKDTDLSLASGEKSWKASTASSDTFEPCDNIQAYSQSHIQTLWREMSETGINRSTQVNITGFSISHTHLQHCFLILRPPNLGLSRQLVQTPQSSGTWQPGHCLQRRDRRPFLGAAPPSWMILVCLITGLMGGDWGSASSEPATEDLSGGIRSIIW